MLATARPNATAAQPQANRGADSLHRHRYQGEASGDQQLNDRHPSHIHATRKVTDEKNLTRNDRCDLLVVPTRLEWHAPHRHPTDAGRFSAGMHEFHKS